MARIIRVQVPDYKVEDVSQEYEWLGGRELTSTIISKEVDPRGDALGPGNKLVLATGLLAGTPAPNLSRLSAGGKSPLTGGIKEANVGGKAGFALGQHDIRAIILEGTPRDEEFYHLIIHDANNIQIIPATTDFILGNYALAKKMTREYGEGIAMISIGPAGVHEMPMASVAVLDLQNYPSRHAGRGGLGAVMGSKGIKSIVILKSKPSRIDYKDPATFKRVAGQWSKELKTSKAGFSRLGTALTVGISQTLKGLPTRNFRMGTFDGADKIGGDHLHELILERGGRYGIPCLPGCAIQCSNLFIGPDGKHATSSLEYETICLNGSNLMIDDIDVIARIDHECDDIGLDTIEFGGTMGVVMESGEMEFGDGGAVHDALNEIRNNTEKGKLYGQGVLKVGLALGVDRIPHAKGQGLPAYDPRVYKGMGVTFCTTPMGGDHTAGAAIYKRQGLDLSHDYGDVSEKRGKKRLSYELQVLIGALDMLGGCYFIGPCKDTLERIAVLLNARYGCAFSWDQLYEKARNMLRFELNFNTAAGITRADNKLPDFFMNEPSEPSGLEWEFDPSEMESFWDEFLGGS